MVQDVNFSAQTMLLQSGNLQLHVLKPEEISEKLFLLIGQARTRAYSSMIKDSTTIDVDAFDNTYNQLVLWDEVNQNVVGGYRFCLTNYTKNLYLSTLYDIQPEFFNHVGPAIELGRSFVDISYQKSSFAFPLLWKGLKIFSEKNPQFTNFIGAVTINKTYSDLSKSIILDYIKTLKNDAECFFKAKYPVEFSAETEAEKQTVYNTIGVPKTIAELSAAVNHCQNDQTSIPPILKYYLKYAHINFLSAGFDPHFDNIIDIVIISPTKEARFSVQNMVDKRFDHELLAS